MKFPKIPKLRLNANQILSKIDQTADRLTARSARRHESTSETMHSANNSILKSRRKIPEASMLRVDRLAQVHRGRSTQARIKAGIGAAVATSGGFLGLHKYHQHKDQKIMDRINQMYEARQD